MRHRRVVASLAWVVAGLIAVALYYALEATTLPNPLQGDFTVHQPEIISDPVRIHFTGDVFLGRDVERRAATTNYEQTLALFHTLPQSVATVINFESAIPRLHQPTPDFGWQFSVPEQAASALAAAGVTHASLANNHAYDFGRDGYAHTQVSLRAAGVVPFGHPSRVTAHDVTTVATEHGTVGLVGLHTLYGQPSLHSVRETVTALDDEVDFLVAYVHWGEEYELHHNRTQRAFAEQLVAAGFDLIIGHHPHVVQGIEMIDQVPVVYSLGNTIFDQYFSTAVQEGLIVSLVLSATETKLELVPITSIGTPTRPRLLESAAANDFLESVAARSDEELASAIRSGVIHW